MSTQHRDSARRSSRGGGADQSFHLAGRVRALRIAAGLTLKEFSERSGISISALSKIENCQLSPTYAKIVALARGLDVDIASLFADETPQNVTGRRVVTRKGDGVRYDTVNYTYELLCAEMSKKHMVPAVTTVKTRDFKKFGPLLSHDGEELIYVIKGKIVLHTEYYEPIALQAGDCAYFDSRMQHGCVAEGAQDAIVFWVCSGAHTNDLKSFQQIVDGFGGNAIERFRGQERIFDHGAE